MTKLARSAGCHITNAGRGGCQICSTSRRPLHCKTQPNTSGHCTRKSPSLHWHQRAAASLHIRSVALPMRRASVPIPEAAFVCLSSSCVPSPKTRASHMQLFQTQHKTVSASQGLGGLWFRSSVSGVCQFRESWQNSTAINTSFSSSKPAAVGRCKQRSSYIVTNGRRGSCWAVAPAATRAGFSDTFRSVMQQVQGGLQGLLQAHPTLGAALTVRGLTHHPPGLPGFGALSAFAGSLAGASCTKVARLCSSEQTPPFT